MKGWVWHLISDSSTVETNSLQEWILTIFRYLKDARSRLSFFESDENLVIVGSNIDEFWDNPTEIKCSRVVPSEHEQIVKKIGRIQPFKHPTIMYKKSEVIRCGGYGKIRKTG